MNAVHTPVMKLQVIKYLSILPDGIYVDATCGEGGHSQLIAPLVSRGRLICIDRDFEVLQIAKKRLAKWSNIDFVCASYDEIGYILSNLQIERVNGILADLGISMYHLRCSQRGFSYTDEQPLDMRFDLNQKLTAAIVINTFKQQEIADILYKYGEELESRRIARAITKHRPIVSAKQLADIVCRAKHHPRARIHPATQTFQALRIYVNRELEILENFIPSAVENLVSGGRLIIISFHSLEDRIVKNYFKQLQYEHKGIIITKKAVFPSNLEKKQNPASRSAKLRTFEKKDVL